MNKKDFFRVDRPGAITISIVVLPILCWGVGLIINPNSSLSGKGIISLALSLIWPIFFALAGLFIAAYMSKKIKKIKIAHIVQDIILVLVAVTSILLLYVTAVY
jgi:hypothetical protein